MRHKSETARFIADRIDEGKKSQHQIAMEAGFESSVELTKIRTGLVKLPVEKIGKMANALDADPIQLLAVFLQEYCPETWQSISPFLDTALTADELSLIKGLRSAVGGPYLTSLTTQEREPLNDFLQGLSIRHLVH